MATEYIRRAIIVVAARDQALALVETKKIDIMGGEKTFNVGLNSSGDPALPITHYWCSWVLKQSEWDALYAEFKDDSVKRQSRMFDGNLRTAQSVLDEMGLKRMGIEVDSIDDVK